MDTDVLIVTGQPPPFDTTLGLGDLLRIHGIPDNPINDVELARAQIPKRSFYLLRPDGHIGLCGVHLDTAVVTRYFSERLGMSGV